MTINSNYRVNTHPQQESEEFEQKFKDVVRQFVNHDLPDKFLTLKDVKNPGVMADIPLEDRIEKADIDYVFEVGPKTGCFHCHIVLIMAKRGCNTKLDYTGISKYLKKNLNGNCYFFSKLFYNSNFGKTTRDVLMNYINKTLKSSTYKNDNASNQELESE